MNAIAFPESNRKFKPPTGYADSQVGTIPAYVGEIKAGACEGAGCVVVAWKPSEADLKILNEGGAIYLTTLGGLPAHMLSTSFENALKS